jgi:hypothetical protein
MIEEIEHPFHSKTNIEISLIKRFQREAHQYGIFNINILNIPEWLTLMQHYGAPTRLLDWTHSPWVGLFFAIETIEKDNFAALWIMDWNAINQSANKTVKEIFSRDHNVISIDDFDHLVNSGDGVIKLNSFRQNQRQIIQQGTFLCPVNIERTFEQNLMKTGLKKHQLIILKIPYSLKHEIIRKLYRMNISNATLFPGIEGFSKSLGQLHYIDKIFKLEDNIKDYKGYKSKFGE